jgi:iron complex outermembrane receptor protein
MGKKLLLSGLFLFCCLLSTFAQQRTVTGKVTSTDGTPLVGATVLVVGQKTGVTTGADGSFSITVPQNAKALQISYVGSETKTVDITSTSKVNVSLLNSATNLSDVVVVGYGTARRRDLTGAITSVQPKDFNKGVIHSADQLLQNKVAGLEVTNTSGQPGAATTIQIRGSSSIRAGANPLYVVDGVILDGGTARPSASTAFGTTTNSDPLLFINPNDIERIDILKDASSTAIYGSRGANGVIIITTKKGRSGPMKVDVGVNFSDFAGYMKKYDILSRSQFLSAISSSKYGLPDSLQSIYNGGANVNSLKEITQNKISQNYSLALSGGNENGNFRASFLASDYEGFIKKNRLKKYLASFNGQYHFIDHKLGIEFGTIVGNFSERLPPIGGSSGSTGSLISAALQWNPTYPLTVNGLYNYPSNGSGNPLAEIDALDDNTNVTEILSHISGTYKLLPNLEYKILYGLNYGVGRRDINTAGWLPSFTAGGTAAILNQTLFTQILDHTLNYNAHLSDNLTLDALAGFEYYSRGATSGSVGGSNFNFNLNEKNRIPLLYTDDLQNAQTQSPYSTFRDPSAELQSYFARATFNYQNKYILTGTIRDDGSSKFGVNNKYAYFPSGAFKWNISNENFMKDSRVFSNLGVRVSYGLTGNQEFPAGASKEQISISPYNTINGSVTPNPNLKWETSKQFDAGIDFAFAKGRVNGSIDYYNKNTSDILFATNAIQPAPGGTVYINLPDAHLMNSGIEAFLAVTAIQNQKFNWQISGNIAYNKNEVTNFTDPNTHLGLVIPTGQITGQGVSGTTAQVFANNQPVNVWYLKHFSGFDQNGNQIVSDNPTFAGNPNPKVIAGISTTLQYNKLSLSINMGGSFGFLLYNNTATSVTNIAGIAQGRNIDLNAYNSAELPSSGVLASDRYLEKGNYWKLRNATLNYNIGNVGKYIQNLSAFVTGSNLFVITKFSGFDPEVNIDKSNNGYPSRSIEYIPYPTPRSITLGLNFSL